MKQVLLVVSLVYFLQMNAQNAETIVVIHTDMGDMTAKLYNETPQHRDNFIKLINEGWYEDSPFHRVIKNFMIQGGGNADGRQDPGYRIPAEFNSAFIHKKGALAAARQGDQVNPEKASSGCQFYIVQGNGPIDANMLNAMSARTGVQYTDEQKETYSKTGGTPHLDGSYTVFGEVIDGFDVIDKIASVETGRGDRPLEEINMQVEVLE